jgi:protein TonB
MIYTVKWKKAMIVSLFLHLLILPVLGYFTAGLTAAPEEPEETFIEMTLDSDPTNSDFKEQKTEQAPSISQSMAAAPPRSFEPSQLETAITPAVTTSTLTMTDADISEVSEAASTVRQSSASNMGGESVSGSAGSAVSTGGGNVGSSLNGIAKPSILSKVNPAYPPTARQENIEGTVVVKIQILTSGRTGEVSIARSSGYPILDAAAIAAVEQWQFIPAKNLSTGQPIACTIVQPISFQLH